MAIRDTSAQDTLRLDSLKWYQKKWIWVMMTLVVVVVIAWRLLVSYLNPMPHISIQRIKLAEVKRGDLVRDISVTGRMVAAISPTLYAPAVSTVNLKVKAGDVVKKGDVVAILDAPEIINQLKKEKALYEQLRAEYLRSKVLSKKTQLNAQKEADQSFIEQTTAKRTFERFEKAGDLGAVSKIDYQRAQDALQTSEIKSRHAQATATLENEDVQLSLQTKAAQLEQQKLNVDSAKRKYDELILKAPVNGVVGTLSVVDKSVVTINAALMTLVDLSQLEVEIEIPENFARELGLDMQAEIAISGAQTANAKGKIVSISPEVVKNQVLGRVRFEGDLPKGVRQSQRVNVRVLLEHKTNVLTVERGNFVESELGQFIYLYENGYAIKKPYQLGATGTSLVEIKHGAKEGDQIVVLGTDSFKNAEKVKINP